MAMRFYYVQPVHAGIPPGTNSGVNPDVLPQQWMTANACVENNSSNPNGFQATISPIAFVQQPIAQPWANVGPVGMPPMCSVGPAPQEVGGFAPAFANCAMMQSMPSSVPIEFQQNGGQASQDGVVFPPAFTNSATMQNTSSSVPMEFQQINAQTSQDEIVFGTFTSSATIQNTPCSLPMECQQANEDEVNESNCPNAHFRDDLHARAHSHQQWTEDTGAVTCEEIQKMRLAVQNTLHRLHKGGFESLRSEIVTGTKHSYKPQECDNDALSSASSTCTPESRVECWADAVVDEDFDASIASRMVC